jgi:uncharacterized protein
MIERVLPFALFMGFIGLEQLLRFLAERGLLELTGSDLLLLYPVKALAVAGLLAFFWRRFEEFRLGDLLKWKDTVLAVLVGAVVFVLWINMDWTLGEAAPGFDPTLVDDPALGTALIAFRLFGAVLVVPVMEEIFWRSFLLRYVIANDFRKVPVGTYTLPSLLIVSVLFALAHHLIVAAFVTSVIYTLLLYRTRSIAQCTLAHAVTNLILGGYVLATGAWVLW